MPCSEISCTPAAGQRRLIRAQQRERMLQTPGSASQLDVLLQQDLTVSWQIRGSPSPKAALSPSSWPRDPSEGISAAARGLQCLCDAQEGWGHVQLWAAGNWCCLGWSS